jgi:hypothetical protein
MIFRLPKVDGNPSALLPSFARLSPHFPWSPTRLEGMETYNMALWRLPGRDEGVSDPP